MKHSIRNGEQKSTKRVRALSVRQPWASLIADGKKTIELRRWRCGFTGELLIVASKAGSKSDGLPRGVALCIVDVVECRAATPADAGRACCKVGEDRFAWVIARPRPVSPVPIRGRLGIFWVEIEE